MSFQEDGIGGCHPGRVSETAPPPTLRPVSWWRENEDATMREFHRIVTENPHLWWETTWVRSVYERYAREQELKELHMSELREEMEVEVEDDSVDHEGWIRAGYLAEDNVDLWLSEYERLGFLHDPDPWEAVGH